jgi:hypothetical protein
MRYQTAAQPAQTLAGFAGEAFTLRSARSNTAAQPAQTLAGCASEAFTRRSAETADTVRLRKEAKTS